MAEPSSALFPEPYGPVEVLDPQTTSIPDELDLVIDAFQGSLPLTVVISCLVLYTRLVQGKPVNPLKWIGWARRLPRKRK